MTIYSGNLRLALQEIGENDETWGDVANEGVFKLLEAAVAGKADIGLASSSVTLTTANGAADQGRAMILNLTGTLAASRTVTVPEVSKVYLVLNQTDGDQDITILPTGGTGVVINGQGAYWVVIDGATPPVAHALSLSGSIDAATLGGVLANLFARKDQGVGDGQTFTKAQGVTRVALSPSGSTVAVNANLSNCFSLAMAGNYTLSNPTGGQDGQTIRIVVKQDATGSRTLAYGSQYKFPGGVVPALSTAANAVDYLAFERYTADGIWLGNLLKGLA